MPHPLVRNIREDEEYDVYVGRPSQWGNPFKIGYDADGTRAEVIAKYREWITTQPHLVRDLPTLKGKRLGCWCSPRPCHADVIAELANVE
jgi:hypothetical protein